MNVPLLVFVLKRVHIIFIKLVHQYNRIPTIGVVKYYSFYSLFTILIPAADNDLLFFF